MSPLPRCYLRPEAVLRVLLAMVLGRGVGEPPTGVREMVLLSFWMSFTHAGLLSRMAGALGKVP